MNRSLVAFAGLLCFSTAFAIDSESLADPQLHDRYRKLTQELRCLQCQNENIHDSNATLAVDLRRQLREMLSAGKSDAEIIQFLTDRYGDFVRYQPPLTGRTLVLWLVPGLALVGALATVLVIVRRRAGKSFDDGDHPGSSGAAS